MTSLGGAENAVRLDTISWFAEVGLSTGDSILGLLFLFNAHYNHQSQLCVKNMSAVGDDNLHVRDGLSCNSLLS